jgi:signal transduction histidine kinase
VAVVSHETRTPLTSVKGALELLFDERYFQNNEQQVKLLTIAHANAERMLLLINDILDFSKLESASLPMTIERQRLEPVVRQAAHNLRMLLEEPHQREIAVPGGCPRACSTRIASRRWSRTCHRTPSVLAARRQVRIEASSSDQVLRLSVRDNGDGIAPKDIPRLFKKFQQIDSGPTRKVGGTGLGLVISKGIVEQHGGRIGVESVPRARSGSRCRWPGAHRAGEPKPVTGGAARAGNRLTCTQLARCESATARTPRRQG